MQRRHRLRLKADFEQLRQEGRRWNHPLVVLVVRNSRQTHSRFAFSASRRVGKAVARNRARRLMREAVRLRIDEIQCGWDCLFIARQEVTQSSFAEVASAVDQLLRRAGLLIQNGS